MSPSLCPSVCFSVLGYPLQGGTVWELAKQFTCPPTSLTATLLIQHSAHHPSPNSAQCLWIGVERVRA